MQESAKLHAERAVLAAQEGRWTDALRHAHTCLQSSPAGSLWQVWALHMLACTYADLGRHQKAKAYALAYLAAAPDHPALERFTPFVVRALSHVHYQRRNFRQSVYYRRQALAMFEAQGNAEQVARTRLNLVWAYVRSGRIREARETLCANPISEEPCHLWHGAHAAILAAEGRWQEAIQAGRLALQGSRLAHDFVDAAKVALIVAQGLRALGAAQEANALTKRAAEFASRQEREVETLVALSLRETGGEYLDIAALRFRGSADPRHGCCFTSGVA